MRLIQSLHRMVGFARRTCSWFMAAANVNDLRPGGSVRASRCFGFSETRRLFAGECGARIVDVCALSKTKVVFLDTTGENWCSVCGVLFVS